MEKRKVKPKTVRALIIALLLAATPTLVLNLVTTTNVYATPDVTPPVLQDIWISPSVVNDGESVTIYVKATDDISGIKKVSYHIYSPGGYNEISSLSYNASSDLWEREYTVPQYSENGLWTIEYVGLIDVALNSETYHYGVDYVANFTVTSSAPVGNIWSSDSMGNAKNSFIQGDSVYVTVPAFGQPISLYVVADKTAWNDGDPLADVSLDGV
jgi:hypothetical protein